MAIDKLDVHMEDPWIAMPMHGVIGANIRNYVQGYESLASSLSGSRIAIEGGAVGDWEGQSADAYRAEGDGMKSVVGNVSEKVTQAAGELGNLADLVDTFEFTTLSGLHDDWEQKITDAISAYNGIVDHHNNSNHGGTDDSGEEIKCDCNPKVGRLNQSTKDDQKGIVRDYVSKSNTLASDTSAAAGKIKALMGDIVPPEVLDQGRDAAGTHLFSGGDTPMLHAVNQWMEMAPIAEDIAEIIGSGEELSQVDLDTLTCLLGRVDPSDPYFVTALLSQVSPEDLIEFVKSNTGPMTGDMAQWDALNEIYGAFGQAIVNRLWWNY